MTRATRILSHWLSLLESVCDANHEQAKPEVATHAFSTVLYIVSLYITFIRALNIQNLYQVEVADLQVRGGVLDTHAQELERVQRAGGRERGRGQEGKEERGLAMLSMLQALLIAGNARMRLFKKVLCIVVWQREGETGRARERT